MRKLGWLYPLCFSMFLLSCTQTPTVALENSQSATLPSATTTPVTVNPVEPKYDLSCWPIKPLQAAKNITGSFVYTIIFPNNLGSKTLSFLALDVHSMHIKRIDNFGPPELSSFDFKKIAAQLNTKIFIITPNDVQTFLVPSYTFSTDAYLEDGRIRLHYIRHDDKVYEEGKGLTLDYYILDPTTGKVQKNTAFLPNFHESEPGDHTLHYSADMKYVLYRSSAYDKEAEFTLFDLEKNKVVWVGPPRDNNLVYLIDSDPSWLPKAYMASVRDRQYLAPAWMPNTDLLTALFLDKSTGQTKYYSISMEGNISPISDFDMSNLINGSWPLAQSSSVVNLPKWTPNGRYLITWGNDNDGGTSMYVWDSQANIVYKPCLPKDTLTVLPPEIMQYEDGSSFMVKLTFNSMIVPEDQQFRGQVSKSYFIDPVKKVIYEVPDLNQMGSPLNTNSDEITSFFGWVDWEIP